MKFFCKTGLLILSIFVSVLLPLSISAGTLYGVGLSGHFTSEPDSSSLYSIDPTTGEGTLIGDLGYPVNAIAIDPVTGLMYGATASWSEDFNGLLMIDPATGTAAEIGEFGASFDAILGLAFSPEGRLFGWNPGRRGRSYLVTIDLDSGGATVLKTYYFSAASPIMAFDNLDDLILINGVSVYEINQSNWGTLSIGSLSFNPGSGDADFDPATGNLWAPFYDVRTSNYSIRVTDVMGNSYSDIETDVQFLQALEFDGFDSDSDGDGVFDSDDFCPETPAGDSVNFEGCSSQQLLDEYCGCDYDWKNHGEYVSCITHMAEEQLAEGIITVEEKGALVSQRARNKCGKKK